jgi:hypothetical protein
VQLVAPDAQLIWNQDLDVRVRSLLSELGASDAPAHQWRDPGAVRARQSGG